MVKGYCRVSTEAQNLDRQIVAMREFGVLDENLYLEKQSGKDFERPVYQKMVRELKKGDVLVIKSIDRLGRSYEDILEEWKRITKVIEADVYVLDMPMLDTREVAAKNLTGRFIADLVLEILGYVAQTEREAIRKRQAEGIACARAAGKHLGRPPKTRTPNFYAMCEKYRKRQITSNAASIKLGISKGTFKVWVAETVRDQMAIN